MRPPIPKGDHAFAAQMRTFQQNIAKHAADLGITPEQVAAQSADADHFNHVVSSQQMMLTTAKAWTTRRKTARKGETRTGGTVLDSDTLAPVLPPPPPPVLPGVEGRFRKLLRRVKASPNYHHGMGVELGIEAASLAAPDYATIQPQITAQVNGDHVELGWDWQGCRAFLDLCEFQVDRNDGRGFVPLTHSVVPGCQDVTPFPAGPAVWKYRASYHAGGRQVGQWSQVARVTVGM